MALTKSIRVLLFLFLMCGGLYYAKPFLAPLVFAGLLAMLLLPLAGWLEKHKVPRGIAVFACTALLFALVSGIIAVLSWQVAGIAQDASIANEETSNTVTAIQKYIDDVLGIPVAQQRQLIKEQSAALSAKVGSQLANVAGSTASFIGTALLTLIYVFMFIYYRSHLRSFVLKLTPPNHTATAQTIVSSVTNVAQQYISGLGMMVGLLWIMYGIGFSLIGVKHALFFAVLCGLLEIMPYIGNLIGTLLTAGMAYTHGGAGMAAWVLTVYGIVQFTQTYFLEPLVVGARVSINPLCTIIVIVLGEMLWGVPGMMLAIPALGVVKILCDNIEPLKPYGFLIGEVKHRAPRKKK